MSITKQVTIWCDGIYRDNDGEQGDCPQWEQLTTTATRARKELKKNGWTTRRVDGETKDYCPQCSKEKPWTKTKQETSCMTEEKERDELIRKSRSLLKHRLMLDDYKSICLSFPDIKAVDIERDIFKQETTFLVKVADDNKRTFGQVCLELDKWRPITEVFIVVMNNDARWMTVLGGKKED